MKLVRGKTYLRADGKVAGPMIEVLPDVFRDSASGVYYLHNGKSGAETPSLDILVPVPLEGYETQATEQKKPETALDRQEGGNHYIKMAIQPIEFIIKNGIGFLEGNVIKYVCRWRGKNGVADLVKARHYLDFLIEEAEKQNGK